MPNPSSQAKPNRQLSQPPDRPFQCLNLIIKLVYPILQLPVLFLRRPSILLSVAEILIDLPKLLIELLILLYEPVILLLEVLVKRHIPVDLCRAKFEKGPDEEITRV